MIKQITALAFLATLFSASPAQTPDKNINKLCGCFEVEFKYAETFSPDPTYKFHDREIINGGIEYVFPVEATHKKIVLQHLLVISDSLIIKHWREDWTYENPVIWKYQGNKTWTRELQKPEAVKGKWTQSIWEVSDEPRYQGTSEWITANGETFWLNTTDAPLPRREYSVRSDYNILNRTNRLVISENGYVHLQDNRKIIREEGKDKLLAEEKGINSYARKDISFCAYAREWWEKNKTYWEKVRAIWEEKIATATVLKMETKVNGKRLHEYLMIQAADFADGKIPAAELDNRIKTYIDLFLNIGKTASKP